MKKAAVIGTAFVDIKGFPDGKYDPVGRNVGRIEYFHGGVARNIAENMANIGMDVSFISMADSNATGDSIVHRLECAGVNTEYISRCVSGGNGVWLAVMNSDGDLAGSISQVPDFDIFYEQLKRNGAAAVSKCDSLVLEIDLNREIAELAFDLAQEKNVPVYAVVGNMSVVLAHPELLAKTECFICNEIEAGKLLNCELMGKSTNEILDAAAFCAERFKIPSIMVTAGGLGAGYYSLHTGVSGWQDAMDGEVIDTSGAGDAFFSGAVSALINGYPVEKAAHYGARLASATIGWCESSCPQMPNFLNTLP